MQEWREFRRLKHHSHGLKNQQLRQFSLFLNEPLAPVQRIKSEMSQRIQGICTRDAGEGHPIRAPLVLTLALTSNPIGFTFHLKSAHRFGIRPPDSSQPGRQSYLAGAVL
jgi:hypothetical protein